jgi:hypothetical protein
LVDAAMLGFHAQLLGTQSPGMAAMSHGDSMSSLMWRALALVTAQPALTWAVAVAVPDRHRRCVRAVRVRRGAHGPYAP